MVGLARYHAKTIPIISSSIELIFDRFTKKYFSTKSSNVIPIRLRNNIIKSPTIYISNTNTNSLVKFTESIESNSFNENLSVLSGESLVDRILSILRIVLLCFIILNLNDDHVTIYCIHHAIIFLI